MFLLVTGTREQAWTDFDPATSPSIAQEMTGRRGGTDQSWLTYCLPGEATWAPSDGVLSFKRHVRKKGLPAHARIVAFHGKIKPWSERAQEMNWVGRHYR